MSLSDRIRRGAESGLRQAADRGVTIAKAQSSGGYTQAQLTRMGHPYARAERGQQRLDPAIINAQTGRFRAAWQPQGPVRTADGARAAVVNASSEARWMKGTTKMVARPVAQAVAERLRPEALRLVRDAVAKELKR